MLDVLSGSPEQMTAMRMSRRSRSSIAGVIVIRFITFRFRSEVQCRTQYMDFVVFPADVVLVQILIVQADNGIGTGANIDTERNKAVLQQMITAGILGIDYLVADKK